MYAKMDPLVYETNRRVMVNARLWSKLRALDTAWFKQQRRLYGSAFGYLERRMNGKVE